MGLDENGVVSTTGDGAIGIFAQSVGGGGGIGGVGQFTDKLGASSAFAEYAGGPGSGGLVTVIEKGSVTTTGGECPGIFAESDGGNNGGGGDVDVAVDGHVIVTGAGSAGVELVSQGENGGLPAGATETVVVGAGGVLEGETTIDYVHGADAVLDNGGTVMSLKGIAGYAFFSPRPRPDQQLRPTHRQRGREQQRHPRHQLAPWRLLHRN